MQNGRNMICGMILMHSFGYFAKHSPLYIRLLPSPIFLRKWGQLYRLASTLQPDFIKGGFTFVTNYVYNYSLNCTIQRQITIQLQKVQIGYL